jgi:acyl-CoA reductase-like NAD-dependent aldehyde dehydrogenase
MALMQQYQLFIDNTWVEPVSGAYLDSVNPYSGVAWASIPRGGKGDVERAVSAAAAAFEGPWSQMSPSARGTLLYRLGTLATENAGRLAEIESRDNGKLISEVSGQVRYAMAYFTYYGGLADKLHGMVVPIDKSGVLNIVRYEPLGVVAAITPWNSSLLLTAWKIAAALCAGNTVVCKPSEFTSASLLEFARLVPEAGFPPGVINVVTGLGDEAGDALIRHPKVAGIAFTGGDEAGRKVYATAAANLKRVSLELGGKSPNIVFDDADLEQAARGVTIGIFSATGQSCMAGSRLLVQESIHDAFVERLTGLVRDARAGDPAQPDTQIGPIATRPQFEKVLAYLDIARQEGARCVAGGRALSGPGYGAGQFIEPTIFVDVTDKMRIAREEVFGPVLAVIKFRDEEDAIRIANDVRFGLAAGVWTRDLHRAMLMSQRLRAGTVWVNNYRSTSYTTPFGGFKDSGIGREGGIEAAKTFMEAKSVWISSAPEMPDPFIRHY